VSSANAPYTLLPFQGAERGSTGMTTDASGNQFAEIRFKAWGEST